MPMTFDATLKDMGRDSPQGFLTEFDQAPSGPLNLLNVDLSTVTTAADLIVGIGEPMFAHYAVPVHTIVLLLRPEAAHKNLNGSIAYVPRPGRGQNLSRSPCDARIRHVFDDSRRGRGKGASQGYCRVREKPTRLAR